MTNQANADLDSALGQTEKNQSQLLAEIESINQELKDFAYIVSHDLKAPLRGIKSLVEWLIADYADKLDEEGTNQLNMLAARVERMHNLIEGVLKYSRVAQQNEDRLPIEMNEVLAEAIDLVAPPDNITVKTQEEMPVIEFEPTRIIQVFQNLLSNAVKYMDKPQGEISIGCTEENGFWKFSVKDNGPGIEEKHRQRIFQMFQTLRPKDEVESAGVGLTVTKKIVEMNGGKIWIESEPGQGSTFYFTVPMKQKEPQNAKVQTNTAC
ncbi:MAG: GHKL domain-containing protein [Sedimentisphaerales bacterium]|nr:GHKL domain-containing protein [Sedimentisphaerales bacterium]